MRLQCAHIGSMHNVYTWSGKYYMMCQLSWTNSYDEEKK